MTSSLTGWKDPKKPVWENLGLSRGGSWEKGTEIDRERDGD